jgi:hypothetical protein
MTNSGFSSHAKKDRRSEHWGRRQPASPQFEKKGIFDDIIGPGDDEQATPGTGPGHVGAGPGGVGTGGAGQGNIGPGGVGQGAAGQGTDTGAGQSSTAPPAGGEQTSTRTRTPVVNPTTDSSTTATRTPGRTAQTATPSASSTSATSSSSASSSSRSSVQTSSTQTSSSVRTTSSSSPILTPSGPALHSTTQTITSTPPAVSTGVSNASDTSGASSSNTGAIVGGVAGGIAGLALLLFLAMFLVKKYRQRKLDKEVFDAAFFRRSAVMLNDPPSNDEPLSRGYSPPPTMAQRYDGQPVSNAGARSWGAGAGVGAAAGYGAAPAYHHQNHTAGGYDSRMYNAYPHYSPGQTMSPPPANVYSQFAPAPPPKQYGYGGQGQFIPSPAAAYGARDADASYQGQPDMTNLEHHQPPAGYLTRQASAGSSDSGHGSYVPVTRGVAPQAVGNAAASHGTTAETGKRPATVYDEADVYGGI